jgi:hypothetical protein
MHPGPGAPILGRRGKTLEEDVMSVMDKLRQMLKGHGERPGEGHDRAGRTGGEEAQGMRPGQVDKGPDALREQMRPPQREQDNPPQP